MKTTGMIVIALVVVVIIAVVGYYAAASHGTQGAATSTALYGSSAPTSAATTTATINNQTSSKATTTIAQNKTGATVYSVKMMSSSTLGNYLANGSGFTLYYNKNDVPNSGNSICYGGCAGLWPPFYTANLVVQSSLNASGFGTITRTDGSKQLTYKGYPLYRYAGDSAAGQANGQGYLGIWYVRTP
jgi:predicted lipoprotein with Yx(FWY)xxD motif